MEPASNYMYWSRIGFQCKNCIEHPFGTPSNEGSTLLLVPLAFLVSCSLLRGDSLLFHFNALAGALPSVSRTAGHSGLVFLLLPPNSSLI